jgi:hypothetical protein
VPSDVNAFGSSGPPRAVGARTATARPSTITAARCDRLITHLPRSRRHAGAGAAGSTAGPSVATEEARCISKWRKSCPPLQVRQDGRSGFPAPPGPVVGRESLTSLSAVQPGVSCSTVRQFPCNIPPRRPRISGSSRHSVTYSDSSTSR